ASRLGWTRRNVFAKSPESCRFWIGRTTSLSRMPGAPVGSDAEPHSVPCSVPLLRRRVAMLHASGRPGLTRVEVIVLAGIIVLAGGLLLPALQQVRAGAGSRDCQNNLRQLALAAHNYHAVYARFPTGMDNQYVGTLIHLLPFLDQEIYYGNFSFDPQYGLY